MKKLLDFLRLPAEVTVFEANYLRRMNRIALAFFWAHLPVFSVIAYVNDTGALAAAVLSAVVLIGPSIAIRALPPRQVSVVYGFTAMCMGALLVHFGQGIVQIEMHFYFFVLIALLAVFANPMVILVAAATVAAHHAIFWVVRPQSVFNYDAPFWVVGVHAAFVVLESVAACFVARSFFDNVIGLEKIVQARTTELDARNRDMRLILDTVEQGFVTVQPSGRMARERSAILERWLGPADDDDFYAWLGRKDPAFAAWLRVSIDAVYDDVLPIELAMDQLPRRWVCEERHFEIGYQLLGDKAQGGILVSLSDVTDKIKAESAEAAQKEMTALVERLLKDRLAVAEFLDEANGLVEILTQQRWVDTAHARRVAHTLKGNAAFFGLRRLADAAHDLESQLSDDAGDVDTTRIAALWGDVRDRIRPFLDESGRIEITDADLERLRSAIRTGAPPSEILRLVDGLRAEPARRRLDRLAEQVRAVAARLGKDVEVSVDVDDSLRLPDEIRVFWPAVIHVLRNAVDHGIESSSERTALGKPATGRIELSARATDHALIFQVRDDGRGIDWEKVRTKANALGLPHATHQDLVAALFVDGLTTRDDVTDVSGRGVGMAAVREAARAHGGSIDLVSKSGRGTTVTVMLPLPHQATAVHA